MRGNRIDSNQQSIVKALRQIPGVTVEVDHDDIILGYQGVTYWYEIKTPEAVSKRTGAVKASEITKTEAKRLATFTGHYRIVWDIRQILEEILK